ncbi:MAG: DUF3256 family protein [Tannerellaceae bacterium]|nr:DUF3256 family protein [Tannerellaceae bacterium]
MKKYSLIITFFLLCLTIQAQEIENYFIAMPDSLIPHLENEWRKDLVDLYSSGKEARLRNMIGGYSTIEQLTPDYLLLSTSERSLIEMKLLPLVNNTYIICLITTVEGPVTDSRIAFYTTDWEPLNSSDLYTPVEGKWFITADNTPATEEQMILDRLDMDLIRYSLNPENTSLTATYMTPYYLTEKERERITPYLKKDPKVYTWNKSYFR